MAVRSTVSDSILSNLGVAFGSTAKDEERAGKNLLRQKQLQQADVDLDRSKVDLERAEVGLGNDRATYASSLINLSYLPDKLETERKQGLATLDSTNLDNDKKRFELSNTKKVDASKNVLNRLGQSNAIKVGENGVFSVDGVELMNAGETQTVLDLVNLAAPYMSTVGKDGSERPATIVGLERYENNGMKGWVPIIRGGENGDAPATRNGTSDPNDPIAFISDGDLRAFVQSGFKAATANDPSNGYLRSSALAGSLGAFDSQREADNAALAGAVDVVQQAVVTSPVPQKVTRELGAVIADAVAENNVDVLREIATELGVAEEFNKVYEAKRGDYLTAFKKDNPSYFTGRPEFVSETPPPLSEDEKAQIRKGRSAVEAEKIISAREAPSEQGVVSKILDYAARVYPDDLRKRFSEEEVQNILKGKREVEVDAPDYVPTPKDIDAMATVVFKAAENNESPLSPEEQQQAQAHARQYAGPNGFNSQDLVRLARDEGTNAALRILIQASGGAKTQEEAFNIIQTGLNIAQRGQTDMSAQDAATMKTNAFNAETQRITAQTGAGRLAFDQTQWLDEQVEAIEATTEQVNNKILSITSGIANEDFDIGDPSNPQTVKVLTEIQNLERNSRNPGKVGVEAKAAVREMAALLILEKAKQNTTMFEFIGNWGRSSKPASLSELSRSLVRNEDDVFAFEDPARDGNIYKGKISASELKRLVGTKVFEQLKRNAPVKEF